MTFPDFLSSLIRYKIAEVESDWLQASQARRVAEGWRPVRSAEAGEEAAARTKRNRVPEVETVSTRCRGLWTSQSHWERSIWRGLWHRSLTHLKLSQLVSVGLIATVHSRTFARSSATALILLALNIFDGTINSRFNMGLYKDTSCKTLMIIVTWC